MRLQWSHIQKTITNWQAPQASSVCCSNATIYTYKTPIKLPVDQTARHHKQASDVCQFISLYTRLVTLSWQTI